MFSKSLTWALVIPTYKREHILLRCLRLGAAQTRLPKEIIVVDASPDYEKTRDLVTHEFGDTIPQIQLIYVKANRASLPAQRNQGIKLSSADVLFLIDDDSLMYPDCAEEVMKIYEADTKTIIKGISPIAVPEPPDLQDLAGQPEQQQGAIAVKPRQTFLRRFIKFILKTDETYFLPYDRDYPVHELPQEISNFNVGSIQVMAGYTMTFRREILQKELFNEVLDRYAAGEDQDLSYRVSRYGPILNAVNARLCHLEISGGRLSTYIVTVLAALNPAVLHQFYSTDLKLSHKNWIKILNRRFLIYLLKDISQKKWDFPRTRGTIYARSQLNLIYSKSPKDLLEWYPNFQQKLIDSNRGN
jgi:GT2 family glycosyltransferase